MKEIKEYDDLTTPIAFTDIVKDAPNMPNMPNHLRKANEMATFLAKNPFPAAWMAEMKDNDIKRCFDQNKSIPQIAQLVRLSETEVLQRLEDMGLVEPVNA